MKVERLIISEEEYRSLDAESFSSLSAFQKLGINYNRSQLNNNVDENIFLLGKVVDMIISERLSADILIPAFKHKNSPFIFIEAMPSFLKRKLLSGLLEFNFKLENVEKILNNEHPDLTKKLRDRYYFTNRNIDNFFDTRDLDYYKALITCKKNDFKKIIITKSVANCAREAVIEIRMNNSFVNHISNDWKISKSLTALAKEPILEYQAKFSCEIMGIKIKCMLDAIVYDHENKTITPVDLKTTSEDEQNVMNTYVKYSYYIQAGLYRKIIYEYFKNHWRYKDYKVLDFEFLFCTVKQWSGPKNPRPKAFKLVVTKEMYKEAFTANPYKEYLSNTVYPPNHFVFDYFKDKNAELTIANSGKKGIALLIKELICLKKGNFELDNFPDYTVDPYVQSRYAKNIENYFGFLIPGSIRA